MKRFIGLFMLSLILTSCELDNDVPNFNFEIIAIDSVDMPESFVYGETYDISITYTSPGSCYDFYDFFYDINENERTVAIINVVYGDEPCTLEEESITVDMNFLVNSLETYIFKFYLGTNDEGVDEYQIIEVPVGVGRSISKN
jgi:hypothetical protein